MFAFISQTGWQAIDMREQSKIQAQYNYPEACQFAGCFINMYARFS